MKVLGMICKTNVYEIILGGKSPPIKFTKGNKYKSKQDKNNGKLYHIKDDNGSEILTTGEQILNDFKIIMSMEC